jgi:hypothetical protein
MTDMYPPARQRPALLAFTEACDTRASALRRDECGDWAVFGRNGHVYAAPGGFQMMIGCVSKREWSAAKKRLAFGKVTQDGDAEGGVILARLPTMAEGTVIRDILSIPKRVHLSDRHLEILRTRARKWHFQAAQPASGIPDAAL